MDFWSIVCWAFVMVLGALLGLLVEDLIGRIDKRRQVAEASDCAADVERQTLKINGCCQIGKAEKQRAFRVNGCFTLLEYRLSQTAQGSTELEIKLSIDESDFRAVWRTEANADTNTLQAGAKLIEDPEKSRLVTDDGAEVLAAFMKP